MKTAIKWGMVGSSVVLSTVLAVAQPAPRPVPAPAPAPLAPLAPIAPIYIDADEIARNIHVTIDHAMTMAYQGQNGQEIAARAQEQAQRAQERAQEQIERELERSRDRVMRMKDDSMRDEDLYNRGAAYLDEGKWDKALESYDAVVKRNGPRADGALYWKAWALYKVGNKDTSLLALKTLGDSFPNSRWKNDAKALEVEVRQSTPGQQVKPGDVSDEEIKLLALQGLMRSDPDVALPAIDKLLKGSGSPRLKARALFVLAQGISNTKSRELLQQVAKGGSNPDLQLKAISYLGSSKESRQTLAEIYASSTDPSVKRRVLQGYMSSSDKEHLLIVAKTDASPDLRQEAIQALANMGARDEVFQLYGSEQSPEVKRQIISSMYSDGYSDKVYDIAKNEKDLTLRKTAIRVLARFRGHSDLLQKLYSTESDEQIKKEIISAVASKNEPKVLVDMGRAETNPELKKEIVMHLSHSKSKEAQDYMMEILSK